MRALLLMGAVLAVLAGCCLVWFGIVVAMFAAAWQAVLLGLWGLASIGFGIFLGVAATRDN